MNFVRQIIKTPQQARALPEGSMLSLRYGKKFTDPSPLKETIRSGRTIVTESGDCFTYRKSKQRFTSSNVDGEVVVLTDEGAAKLARRNYMRRYMHNYEKNMTPEQKSQRRKYMRDYMQGYRA